MLGNQQQQMENQHQQTELLRQELAAPKEQKPGNISDFRRLQPAVFTGVERPLEAEQWLTDTTDLLNAARVPKENQVEVAKIQLKDIARTWWLAEEARLKEPISWDTFSKSFYSRFFPATAQKDMEEQFIRLQQGDRSVDEYAAEFLLAWRNLSLGIRSPRASTVVSSPPLLRRTWRSSSSGFNRGIDP